MLVRLRCGASGPERALPADAAAAVPRLRAKPSAAGHLQSTPQQAVTTEGSGDTIQYLIQPTNPEVVYVPQYNPSWAYGPWPYPAYPPVYYPFGGALATGFFWGLGIAAGAGTAMGNADAMQCGAGSYLIESGSFVPEANAAAPASGVTLIDGEALIDLVIETTLKDESKPSGFGRLMRRFAKAS